jgi:hypothetical protein
LDNSGNFNAIKYLGNLSFSPTLIIEPLSYYEIQFKFNIENDDNNDYEHESYVSSVYMNLTSNNLDFKTNISEVTLIGSGDTTPTHTDFTIEGTALN